MHVVHEAFVFPDTNLRHEGENPQYVYAVRFRARDLWPDGDEDATVLVDLWESYLEPAAATSRRSPMTETSRRDDVVRGAARAGDRVAADREGLPDRRRRSTASSARTSTTSARCAARGRRARLGRSGVQGAAARRTPPRRSPSSAIGGFVGEHVLAVENTDDVHNVVVCTLCSCYPWAVLGLPPTWYKSPAYRSRVVREPRAVLARVRARARPGRRRSASGTRAPTCATWCCPSARPAPRA